MNKLLETSYEKKGTASLMRRALDLMPDGVLIIGSSREVLYMNEAFETLWRIPRSVVLQGDQAMLVHVLEQLDDPDAFMLLVNRLYGSTIPSEDQLSFKDGRLFNRRSVALPENDGGYSRIWIFSDITEAWSARVDALTGLLNRRAYAQELPEFMASVGDQSIKAFALLDVDNFKAYNDQYGHAKGDAVLERIGELLRFALKRSTDRAYRIGGEELAMASRHRDRMSAASFYEGMLTSIRGAKIEHRGNPPHGCITVSMGLGLFEGAREPEQIFGEVDRALYRAKRHGRNRMEFAQLPVS
ncbi:diguanylate cyclase [Arsenicitalea aurantiaca]|uniref:diguanylate cyclase n=1 Tax=Arsenicitalea aurantiaca TaxID=1783274 RepID=A0A433X2C3_9HYPH|nr:sensor domain-containing diguanylate cyclase [Arsenicitalea aurantiaca]RUT28244.1 diguanylate cyclase [Arsenicitalea aurantiaca]